VDRAHQQNKKTRGCKFKRDFNFDLGDTYSANEKLNDASCKSEAMCEKFDFNVESPAVCNRDSNIDNEFFRSNCAMCGLNSKG